MSRLANIVTLTVASWLLSAGIIMAVWHILDDRSVDIAVPDEAIALVKHDPNPPMMAWRPRIPESVGTSVITLGSGASVCRAPNGDLMDLSACSGRSR